MRGLVLLLCVVGLGAAARFAVAGERVDVTATDGVQLVAELDGASGPGVVLVHDAREDGRVWRPLADALAARGYRILRVDLRGHGASGGVADLAAVERDVEGAYRYVVGRKIRPVFLVGKGATAPAVARVAARLPTAGVVLVGGRDADGDTATLAVPVLRLEGAADPEAFARLTTWLASLH